jgi:hypothetical protein
MLRGIEGAGASGFEIVQQSPIHPHQDNAYYYGTTFTSFNLAGKKAYSITMYPSLSGSPSKCPAK